MTRYHTVKKTTTAGFEPTLPKGNCLAGNRLNHSATLSSIILYRREFHYIDCQYNTHNIYRPKLFLKKRQWQDLNLRIQRIIDFKSIALDHSATLSYTTLLYFPLPDIYDYTRDKTWHPNIHDNIYAPTICLFFLPTILLYHLTLKMPALTPAPLLYTSNLQ